MKIVINLRIEMSVIKVMKSNDVLNIFAFIVLVTNPSRFIIDKRTRSRKRKRCGEKNTRMCVQCTPIIIITTMGFRVNVKLFKKNELHIVKITSRVHKLYFPGEIISFICETQYFIIDDYDLYDLTL